MSQVARHPYADDAELQRIDALLKVDGMYLRLDPSDHEVVSICSSAHGGALRVTLISQLKLDYSRRSE